MGSAVFHLAQTKLWSTLLKFSLQGTRYLVKSGEKYINKLK